MVLESDADRERFGVKRRFQIRDGENFFAEGRENANWELIQQQMKRAGTWRLGLRRQVLQQLSRLGRDVPVIQPRQGYGGYLGDYFVSFGRIRWLRLRRRRRRRRSNGSGTIALASCRPNRYPLYAYPERRQHV